MASHATQRNATQRASTAARHPLLGNCLYCGKIVCAQEGVGPCLFCGNAVGEAPGAGSISLSKQEVPWHAITFTFTFIFTFTFTKRFAHERTRVRTHMSREVSPCYAWCQADAEYDASLARALEHKDKLLEYERTSARRTVIYGTQPPPLYVARAMSSHCLFVCLFVRSCFKKHTNNHLAVVA